MKNNYNYKLLMVNDKLIFSLGGQWTVPPFKGLRRMLF